jgi:hypothetical protein
MGDFAADDVDLCEEIDEEELEAHWRRAANRGLAASCNLYAEDAVLEFPQSGRTITGRANIAKFRAWEPARSMISLERLRGRADLWISEYTCMRSGSALCVVSIMEFEDGLIRRETEYSGERI